MDFATYTIRNADTGEVLAIDITPEQVDAWWSVHGTEFFGVRVTENVIQVVKVQ